MDRIVPALGINPTAKTDFDRLEVLLGNSVAEINGVSIHLEEHDFDGALIRRDETPTLSTD